MDKEKMTQENSMPGDDGLALDDEQRVKVLSPGMLVAKRFFRNKLAMAGLIILITMFVFSFVGGVVSPYRETQVFRVTEEFWKDYAGAAINTNWIFETREGAELSNAARQRFILVSTKGGGVFEADGQMLQAEERGLCFVLYENAPVATVMTLKGKSSFRPAEGFEVTEEMKAAFQKAVEAGEDGFELDGTAYSVTQSGREMTISSSEEIGMATKKVFNTPASDQEIGYEVQLAALEALAQAEATGEDQKTFTVDNKEYMLSAAANTSGMEIFADGELIGTISDLLVSSQTKGNFLSLNFKEEVEKAIAEKTDTFTAENSSGEEETYQLLSRNTQYVIRNRKNTIVNATYQSPSYAHPLGTDGNGMDMLTRLMYGGRISLLIGFVVILIETLIGIVIGGLSGYFGGWTDTALMRIVDVVICIPAMPLYIIIGAVMDYYQVDPRIRIYLLCVILGLLGWPGIARMVRGQILSLREQEFMIAAEATGVRISRRIFRHLIPNVIPQLIVIATMGLGDVILTEATLSFLGLGVKFPFASWGNIVNAVNDAYVLTNYWFVWIPAGFLILITVLGFNFVGDGLRDAFDPKMKR